MVKTSAGKKVWQQIGERVQRFAQQQVMAAHGRSAVAPFIDEEQILPQLDNGTQGSPALPG